MHWPVCCWLLCLFTPLTSRTCRNGFSLRHDHHETMGANTRLYMSPDPAGGYVDVPTAEIQSFEPAPPDPQEVSAAAVKSAT